MTVKLFGFKFATPTFTVVLCLHELGIPYEAKFLTFQDLKTEDYLANKHPFAKAPVLIDGDFKITESRPICRYLVSKYQGKYNDTVLVPNDIYEASLVNQLISYELSYYEPPLTKMIFQEVVFKRQNKQRDPVIVNQACEELAKVLDVYEKLLEGKEYLNGQYSLADLFHYHYPGTHYLYTETKHSKLLDDRPNVKRWWDNLSYRNAWKKTLVNFISASL